MTQKKTSIVLLAAVTLAALFIWGCSDDTIRTVVSEDDYLAGGETSYFLPLTEGFTTVYRVTYGDGSEETISLEVGRQVQSGPLTAYEWFSDDGHIRDTGYVRVTTDAAFFYDGADGDPEKILGFPLVEGNSWERFSETYADEGFVDIITDYDDTSAIGIDGVLAAKAFPSTGANMMTVMAVEQLQLENGDLLSNTIKVYNESTMQGKKNYYWYAENIGLVKYILGTTDGSYPRGDVSGELIDFGS